MIYRVLIILVLLALTVFYSVYQKNSLQSQLVTSSDSASVLKQLPQGQFTNLEEGTFDLHGFYEQEPIELLVVHFWGTWCAPCEAELPDLLAFMKRFEGRQGVKFLLVAVNDDRVKVQKHIKALALPKASIHWVLDNNNVHRDLFGTTRVPETYIFSSDKTMLRKYLGPQEWNKTLFFRAFDEFLQMSVGKL